MSRLLKQSTARSFVVLMVDSTDHVSGKTGLTLTITASKDGGAFASITPTVTELATGWYTLALTSSHTDTLGDFALHITGTGADPTDVVAQVVALLPGEAVTLAADQAVNVTKVNGAAQTAGDLAAMITVIDDFLDTEITAIVGYIDTEITAIKAKTDLIPATPASTGDAMTLTVAERAAIADKLLGRNLAGGADGTRTVKDALRVLRNKVSIAAGTLTVTEEDDSTAAWTAAVTTAAGNPINSIDPS
jgi:hypothetical protein